MSLFFLKQNLTDHVWDFRNQIKPSASKIIISQDYVLAWKKGSEYIYNMYFLAFPLFRQNVSFYYLALWQIDIRNDVF